MQLGTEELLRLVHAQGLVENLSERELSEPEGAGFDLRVGQLWNMKHVNGAFIGATERRTPDYEPIKPDENNQWRLYPQGFWLVETMESVDVPGYLVGHLEHRTTMFTCGLFLAFGPVQPGYHGALRFGLRNATSENILLERGARIAH